MESENRNGNGNTVLLTVIGVATLLVALVGATFAYFSATITNNAQQSVVLTTAAPVGLEYLSQTQIALENSLPGQSSDGQFTVKNPDKSTVAQEYDLELVINENTFTTELPDPERFPDAAATYPAGTTALPNQLLVTVAGTSDRAGATINIENCGATACDLTDGSAASVYATGKRIKLVESQRIEIGETHTYTVNLNFVDLILDGKKVSQDANQDKTFNSHIEIVNPVSVR